MKVILTGATGMVGEGVLLECLENDAVIEVLSISRKPSGYSHSKLKELFIANFTQTEAHKSEIQGYDACFYCAGISSAGMSEKEYTIFTYDATIAFANAVSAANPEMVFNYVSGRGTDSTEQGRTMWARVKGKTENALQKIPFKRVFHFRPALMKPFKGQKHFKGYNKYVHILYPVLSLFFPSVTLKQVGRAMINGVTKGFPKQVIESADIKVMAES